MGGSWDRMFARPCTHACAQSKLRCKQDRNVGLACGGGGCMQMRLVAPCPCCLRGRRGHLLPLPVLRSARRHSPRVPDVHTCTQAAAPNQPNTQPLQSRKSTHERTGTQRVHPRKGGGCREGAHLSGIRVKATKNNQARHLVHYAHTTGTHTYPHRPSPAKAIVPPAMFFAVVFCSGLQTVSQGGVSVGTTESDRTRAQVRMCVRACVRVCVCSPIYHFAHHFVAEVNVGAAAGPATRRTGQPRGCRTMWLHHQGKEARRQLLTGVSRDRACV